MLPLPTKSGCPKDRERFKWVRAFFAAKARQYAQTGYPGTGGLLPEDQTRQPEASTAVAAWNGGSGVRISTSS